MAVDNTFVKKAHQKCDYNEDKLQQLVACVDQTNGPLYFMRNFIYVQHPTKGRVKLEPYDFQLQLIDSYHNARKSISLVSRQMGKSTVAAAYILWYAMFKPDSLVILASKTRADAKEIMQKIRYAYEEMPDYIRAGAKSYNVESVEFDNGSRIIAESTTENTGRGKSASLIYLDEFAFVETRMAREMWAALSPTLSTGGKIIITSTPNTDEDQFAELWFGAIQRYDNLGEPYSDGLGKNGFRAFSATWEAHPDRDEAWAAGERATLGEERFRREHMCHFVTYEETLINSAKLLKLNEYTRNPIRKSGTVRWFKRISKHSSYVIALDPSMGTGGDGAAIVVFELPSFTQVAEWTSNRHTVEEQLLVLKKIAKEIAARNPLDVYWSIENNTMGEATLVAIRQMGEESFPGIMLHDPKKGSGAKTRKGFNTTARIKLETCVKLKSWIEQEKMKIRSKVLLSQLKTFIAINNTYRAKSGNEDDLVMATILTIRMIDYISSWDDLTWNKITSQYRTGDDDEEYDLEPMPMGIL